MKPDRYATFNALQDPDSELARTIAEFLRERMLIKLRYLNVPGLEDIKVRLKSLECRDAQRPTFEATAIRDDRILGQAINWCEIILPEPSHKEVTNRLHRQLTEKLCHEIVRSNNENVPVLLDTILHDHLRRWLTPRQILNYANKPRSGKYVIRPVGALEDENIVEKFAVDTRAYCLSARINLGEGVAYDHGQVFVPGTLPATLGEGLSGRDIHSIVEADLLKNRGPVKLAAVQKTQLRLVIDRAWFNEDELWAASREDEPITHIITKAPK